MRRTLVGQAGVEDVAGAVDVDGPFERAVGVLAGRDDRGEVDHDLGTPLVHDLVDAGRVADVHQHVVGVRRAGRVGHPQVGADDLVPGRDQPGDDRGAEEAAASGDQDSHAGTASRLRRTTPDGRDDQPGDDVVDAPPGGHQRHPAEAVEVGEHQQQPEPGVADPDLEGHRLHAGRRQSGGTPDRVAEQQRERVVQEHCDHDDADVVHEDVPVLREAEHDDQRQPDEGDRADDLVRPGGERRERTA